jgi:hypothetical protein
MRDRQTLLGAIISLMQARTTVSLMLFSHPSTRCEVELPGAVLFTTHISLKLLTREEEVAKDILTADDFKDKEMRGCSPSSVSRSHDFVLFLKSGAESVHINAKLL